LSAAPNPRLISGQFHMVSVRQYARRRVDGRPSAQIGEWGRPRWPSTIRSSRVFSEHWARADRVSMENAFSRQGRQQTPESAVVELLNATRQLASLPWTIRSTTGCRRPRTY